MGAYPSPNLSAFSSLLRVKLMSFAVPLKFVQNCVLFPVHLQVLKKSNFGQFMSPARQYQSNMTKRPQWILMVAKTTQWASWKWIIEICYSLLHENEERKPPLMDTFYGDNEISAHFFRPNFEQEYLPWHLLAMIPIATPPCTEIARLALRWFWKLDMWASCWNRPIFI